MFGILTAQKDFNHGLNANVTLNKWGLHRWRVRQAARAVQKRKHWREQGATGAEQDLLDHGIAVIPDFLSAADLSAVQQEAEHAITAASNTTPPPQRMAEGFGDKQPHQWGFDRFDGGTLNRFIDITDDMPAIQRFARDQRLSGLTARIVGLPHDPHKVQIYETYHGEDTTAHDLQKDIHRDTFFPSMKFWFFLDEVTHDDGPFHFARGSHLLSENRLQQEHDLAMAALTRPKGMRGGSFRTTAADLTARGLNQPEAITAPAGTLVIANTFGWHARGMAAAGKYRRALYGWLRAHPFIR